MPDGITNLDREAHSFAWALAQLDLLRRWPDTAAQIDAEGLRAFLEDYVKSERRALNSLLANLMEHLVKAALTRNPQVIGKWRRESVEFHSQAIDIYEPAMRQYIDIEDVWRKSRTFVTTSFRDHGEPTPKLPTLCPFTLPELLNPDLDVEALVAELPERLRG